MHIQTSINNLRYYEKYLDVKETTEKFLRKKGYLPLNLPVLSPALVPESYLEVFETEFVFLETKEKLYLTPSPELFIKRLLAYGIGDCYSLGKSFRNSEPESSLHSSEFTMLEFYKMNADYMSIADEVLLLLQHIAQTISSSNTLEYKERKISFSQWEKISVAESFEKYGGIHKDILFHHKLFLKQAEDKGYIVENFSYEDVFSQMYVQEIEPHLGQNGYPTLIYDYPKEFAALARLNDDGKTAQRFEFYIHGIELGDCYTELTNPQQQEQRFTQESMLRIKGNKISHPTDTGFIDALKHGLAECSGIAIGFDRLAMIFAGADSIDQLRLINIR